MKKKLLLTSLGCLFIFGIFSGKSQPLDSLILIADTTENPIKKTDIYLMITNQFNEASFPKAVYYGKKAMKLAQQNSYQSGIAQSHWLLGFAYYYRADYHTALNHFLSKLQIDKTAHDTLGMAATHNLLGNIYYLVKDYAKAKSLYNKALTFYESTNSAAGLSDIYTNLGNISEALRQTAQSEEFYNKGLHMDQLTNDTTGIVITLNNLGNLYYKQYSDTLAGRYFREALSLLKSNIGADTRALVYINYGDFLLWQDRLQEAKYYIDKGYDLSLAHQLPFYIAMSAKSKMNYFKQTNNYQRAFKFQSMAFHLQDSIMNSDVTNRITMLQLEHEQAQEENIQKLAFLKQQKQLRTHQWLAFSMFLIVLFSSILFLVNVRARRKQNRLKEAKWKTEKERLNEQLSFRNREITLKVMALMERNELIKEVIARLQKSVLKMKKTNQQEVEAIIKELNTNCTENITKEFEYRFQQVHTRFYQNLTEKYPSLTPNDLRLSAFLRLNMSTKDIAAITHQSVNAIEVARTRLRKKLQLQQTDTDLVNFLSHF